MGYRRLAISTSHLPARESECVRESDSISIPSVFVLIQEDISPDERNAGVTGSLPPSTIPNPTPPPNVWPYDPTVTNTKGYFKKKIEKLTYFARIQRVCCHAEWSLHGEGWDRCHQLRFGPIDVWECPYSLLFERPKKEPFHPPKSVTLFLLSPPSQWTLQASPYHMWMWDPTPRCCPDDTLVLHTLSPSLSLFLFLSFFFLFLKGFFNMSSFFSLRFGCQPCCPCHGRSHDMPFPTEEIPMHVIQHSSQCAFHWTWCY